MPGSRASLGRDRRRALVGVGIAAFVAVAGCSGDDGASPSTTSAAATTTTVVVRPDDGRLVLGALLPRTGPGALLGEPMFAAVERAVAEINQAGGVLGEPVELVSADENAGSGLDELLQAEVDALIGPASSLVAISQLDDIVHESTGIVSCSPSATSLALDDYPDNKFFFRTVPSDSLQMGAIARRAAGTGIESVALAYLDDRYGRGLAAAFASEAATRGLDLAAEVGFSPDQEELAGPVSELLADDPGVIVVLGDGDDGTRFLAALDLATQEHDELPEVIVNDAIRNGRQTIQSLSQPFIDTLTGIAPQARPPLSDEGFFATNAIDCVNLIALAAVQADSDAPTKIQANMAAVSDDGRACISFADCVEKLDRGLQIDYDGESGGVELSTSTGDLTRGVFEVFAFDDQGADLPLEDRDPPFLYP